MAGQPEVAMSANLPFAPQDVVLGQAEPSGLPYSTLLTLPSRGIVIIATFMEQDSLFLSRADTASGRRAPLYPERELPLHIRDATPFIQYGTQVRPEEPLGQYQLRASLEHWYVDVHVYFGTSRPSPARLAEAQRQLDRMVVRSALVEETAPPTPAVGEAASAPGVVDRTFSCTPALVGGVNKLYALASRGTGRHGTNWERPAFGGVRTNLSGSAATAIDNYLVWAAAGRPSVTASIPHAWRIQLFEFPFRVWGTIAVNRTRCRASTSRVPLTADGLTGGNAGVFPDEFDCTTPRSVLIRIRAVTESRTTLRSYRNFFRTAAPVTRAAIAIQTQGGKRLALAQLGESGSTRILVAQPPCYPN
jgi:hypothetical protein